MNYKFDPTKFGYEPITNFPELSFNYLIDERYYVKIIAYSNYGDLVYWYSLIGFNRQFQDDRVKIVSGTYDFRRPCEYGKQTTPHTDYFGIITNDEFASELLAHLNSPLRNEGICDGIKRMNENLGIKMREEFSKHYK
jgi:hypothetical protein